MSDAPEPRPTLGRRGRITRPADFRAVYAARARAADGRLVVYARPNGREETRVGLSVGKRCGPAVARNRTKRLLREAFRHGRAGWPAGYDIVIVPLGRGYTLEEMRRRLEKLVPQALERAAKRAAGAGSP